MNKFKVKIAHIFSELLDIEAVDETEAKKIAEEKMKITGRQFTPLYEATLPPENWAIITEEQYKAMVEEALAERQKIKN
jgi:hypothetical protein